MILKITIMRIRLVGTRMDTLNMSMIVMKAGRPNTFVLG